jgi:antitoxin HicB
MAIGPYPAVLDSAEGDDAGYTVTFRDLPEAITEGDTEEQALRMAEDVLASALSYYAEQGKALPRPSAPKRGDRLVFLPTLIQAKLALWIRMGELGMTKADLADRLGVDHKAARRLMKLDHGSRIENVDAALNALGKRLSVRVDEWRG